MSQGGGSKASFRSLDDGRQFTVQYNPAQFTVTKALTWEESKQQGIDQNSVQFQKTVPMTASFDLHFDTTGEGGDVHTQWVGALLALAKPEVQPAQGEPTELTKKRPRAFQFVWGSFEMECVFEAINVTYLMFAADGTPVRAKATVKLKEWKAGDYDGSGSGFAWDTDKLQLVQVQGGQTLTQVAQQNNTDWRQLAEDNGITDPLAELTGATLYFRS